MSYAKRYGTILTAVLLSLFLGLGLFSFQGTASAATVKSTSLTTAQSAVSKNPYATSQAKKIAIAAAAISYSRTTYQGKGKGTKAYLAVVKKYMGSYYVNNKKQMQCNVPPSAAVRLSGVDKKFATSCKPMYSLMKSSKKWKCLGNYSGKESSLRPGDILIRIAHETTYTGKNGKKVKASTNHACVYVGKQIASSVYNKTLKGTDADKGKPGSTRVFVSAHTSTRNAALRSASCMETAKQAYADCKMLVFRYVG